VLFGSEDEDRTFGSGFASGGEELADIFGREAGERDPYRF